MNSPYGMLMQILIVVVAMVIVWLARNNRKRLQSAIESATAVAEATQFTSPWHPVLGSYLEPPAGPHRHIYGPLISVGGTWSAGPYLRV